MESNEQIGKIIVTVDLTSPQPASPYLILYNLRVNADECRRLPPLSCADLRTCPSARDRFLGIFPIRKMRKTLRMLNS